MSAKRFKPRQEIQADLNLRDERRTLNVELPTLNGDTVSAEPKRQQGDADLHSPEAGGASHEAPPAIGVAP